MFRENELTSEQLVEKAQDMIQRLKKAEELLKKNDRRAGEGNMNMRALETTIEDYKRIMLNTPRIYLDSEDLLETQFKRVLPAFLSVEERKFLCDSLIEAICGRVLDLMGVSRILTKLRNSEEEKKI